MAARTPRIKLWLESDGKLVMSDYRVRLLEAIEEAGSLSKAAESMHLSYRRAWGKLRELERNLGFSLVESAAGGPSGGGTKLTEDGRSFIESYRRFQERAVADVQRAFDEELADLRLPGAKS